MTGCDLEWDEFTGTGYFQNISILAWITLIATLGVAILTGYTGLFTIGHAGFMAAGEGLMLDEPSLGLAPIVYEAMFDVLMQLNQEKGMTILLVEQNAILALGMSDRAYVLETGRIALEGKGEDLLEDPRVQASYLGIAH